MTTKSRIPLSRILLLLLISLQIAIYVFAWLQALGHPNLSTADFIIFYGAGRLARSGDYHRLYDIDAQALVQRAVVGSPDYDPLIFNHPPYLVPVLAAISVDDYLTAFVLWTLVRLAALYICGAVIYRLLLHLKWNAAPARLAAAGCLLFFPVFVSLLGGQDTVFALLGLLLGMIGLLEGREILSGLALAFATIAPTISGALALPLLAARRRSGLWFVAGTAALALYSVLLVGVDGMVDFAGLLMTSTRAQIYGFDWPAMYNLLGMIARSLPGLDADLARLIAWAAAFLSILALCVWWWNKREHLSIRDIGLGVTLVVFTSPHLYLHALSFLLLPMLAFIGLLWDQGRREAALLFVPVISTMMLLLGLLAPALNFAASYALMVVLAWGLASNVGWARGRQASNPSPG